MIEVRHVTKRYGEKVAVDDLSFAVHPGVITGFLGPNGAGKSTTMRVILGLDAPTSGTALIEGKDYRDLPAPLHAVGAMLESRAIHTGRSGRDHLLAIAATHRIPTARVDQVLSQVGLQEVARKRVGGFSLGMTQRLGIAAALLGDPRTLVLDEPANGLDPEGIHWIRTLLKDFAADGRTVFLSSHLLSEIAVTADHLLVVGRGRLIADASVADIVARASQNAAVRVRTPHADALVAVLTREGGSVVRDGDVLEVHGVAGPRIGELAASEQLVLHELTPQQATLEDAFMALTATTVEYQAAGEQVAA
jgi:ABC-2 type transport system ATP-binding protein